MSIEILLASIGIMLVIITILVFWIGVMLQGIVTVAAPQILKDLEQIVINLAMIIRQNSVVPVNDAKEDRARIIDKLNTIICLIVPANATPAPKPAKVAKVQPTYQPKRNRA